MARVAEQVQVKVEDCGVVEGKRRLSVEVEAGEQLFYLCDALAREGVVRELRSELRSAVRKVVVEYVGEGSALVRKMASERVKREEENSGRGK